MVSWLIYRLGRLVIATWAIASIAFMLSRLSSQQPEQVAFSRSDSLGPRGSAAVLLAGERTMRHRLGLDVPLFYVSRRPGPPVRWQWNGTHNQYHLWLRQLLHGQLGLSYYDGQPIGPRIGAALRYTVPLMLLALALAVGIALLLAQYMAAGTGLLRRAVLLGLLGLQALPLFALALGLLLLLANPELFNILPDNDLSSEQASFGNLVAYLLLPLPSLVLSSLPELTLPLVATLRHELAQPYATAARAKGLSVRQVLRRHALPNAVLPLVVQLAGLLPNLAAGAVVVEVLFALPGMGRLMAGAAYTQDFPVLLAGVLLVAAARLLALLAADVVHYRLDPRLRAALA
jgi:peptide/nickel transport system permease protein